jgi:glutamate/tyrosine decarboxylase-like PLP-dependent enzyme
MDPEEFRRCGHRLIDRLADYLAQVEDTRLFPDVAPRALEALFAEPLPQGPMAADDLLAELDAKLFPYAAQVSHPGYFGLITPTPAPAGVLADLVASALNQNIGAYAIGPAAVAMERRTVRWLTDLVGWGAEAGGNLTSGGTMANFIGLKLARDWATGDAAQRRGLSGRWAAYVSEERHVSVDKAADAVGVGREGLRVLPTDERFRVRLDALEAAIADDRRRGVRPMCVIGLAGTTNTGAVDALAELRRVADRERAWLHVDAAYGGGMLLSREHPGLLAGLELADSITLDPHKWFFQAYDIGGLLVRRREDLLATFHSTPEYYRDVLPEDEPLHWYHYSIEGTRRFRALKLWLSWKHLGTEGLAALIERTVDTARYFARRARDEGFDVIDPDLSVVCFRWPDGDDAEQDRLQRALEVSGDGWLSTTRLRGRTWLRAGVVNHLTGEADVDRILARLVGEARR